MQFSSKRKGIRAWNFRMMIRKIWQFFWYQNRNNFEKNEKRKDQAPLSRCNVRLTLGGFFIHDKCILWFYSIYLVIDVSAPYLNDCSPLYGCCVVPPLMVSLVASCSALSVYVFFCSCTSIISVRTGIISVRMALPIESWYQQYPHVVFQILVDFMCTKHLKKSNAACFYTPIVLKLFIIVQMWKQHEEENLIAIILTPHLSKLIKYW